MNIGYNLNLTQEQKLIMTIEMQQSIKILQMTSFELLEYINKEIQENVVLEYKEPRSNDELIKMQKESYEYNSLANYLEADGYVPGRQSDGKSEYVSPLDFISTAKTLKDYLRDQLLYMDIGKRREIICRYIIEDIDSRGYLDEDIIAFLKTELSISDSEAEECLHIVQGLEPSGVGARSLTECLLLQLNRRNIHDAILESIIKDSLVEISKGRMDRLASKYGISQREAERYGSIVKSLEPKPSRGFFTGEDIGYIIPDIYIRKNDGRYIVLLNDGIIPRLEVNNDYRKVLKDGTDPKAAKYIKGKIEDANFLIKSIEKRKNTILKVVEEIVKIQQQNIEKGMDELKPMTIGDVSKRVGLHESTVSRAVKDKYAALPDGRTIRLRTLFNNHLSGENGDVSSLSIKHDIKVLIEKEDKKRPLSDEDICNILKNRGIDISRRTVAKYRTEQNIMNSARRRRVE